MITLYKVINRNWTLVDFKNCNTISLCFIEKNVEEQHEIL